MKNKKKYTKTVMDLVRENEIEASVCQSGTTNPTPSLLLIFFVISPLSWASQTSNRNNKTNAILCAQQQLSQPARNRRNATTRLERGQKWERARVSRPWAGKHVTSPGAFILSTRSGPPFPHLPQPATFFVSFP